MSAAIFAKNIFTDWKGERTITSLKTISKPVAELDFPSVTICKDGQSMQAVREALEKDIAVWEAKRIKRETRESIEQSLQARGVTLNKENIDWQGNREKRNFNPGPDFCQLHFNRTCKEVIQYILTFSFCTQHIGGVFLYPIDTKYPVHCHKVVEIVRALASRDIERSVESLALHVYATCNSTVNVVPDLPEADPSDGEFIAILETVSREKISPSDIA